MCGFEKDPGFQREWEYDRALEMYAPARPRLVRYSKARQVMEDERGFTYVLLDSKVPHGFKEGEITSTRGGHRVRRVAWRPNHLERPSYGVATAQADPARVRTYTAEWIGKKFPELDPTGLSPHAPGAKLDKGKPKIATFVLRYFPRALECVARISEMGARKYTPGGWQHVKDGVERYEDAEVRHITDSAKQGSDQDPESELPHYCHRAWDALASAELALREEEK